MDVHIRWRTPSMCTAQQFFTLPSCLRRLFEGSTRWRTTRPDTSRSWCGESRDVSESACRSFSTTDEEVVRVSRPCRSTWCTLWSSTILPATSSHPTPIWATWGRRSAKLPCSVAQTVPFTLTSDAFKLRLNVNRRRCSNTHACNCRAQWRVQPELQLHCIEFNLSFPCRSRVIYKCDDDALQHLLTMP